MSTFLLELRSEEIPARMQKGARAELEKLFRAEMEAAGVTLGELTIWSTPRRLALIARDLPAQTEAVSEEAKGPPVGAPDPALEGFCRKVGIDRADLEERDVKGRATYFAVKNIPGRPIADILAIHLPLIVQKFSWPKSMRWGAESISTESLRWVRPLSGIVAILGDDVLEIDFSVGKVYQDRSDSEELHLRYVNVMRSGNTTKGHRFHHAGDIAVTNAATYAEQLRAAHVIVDHSEREAIIRDGARKVAADAGLDLVEDEGLVVENAGLTEWPVPLLGRFEDDFLEVPPETIQLTARVNQKYFVCEKDGKLANAFVCTANIDAVDPAVVVDGNRKVLAARLSDAKFFWDVDRKKTLEQHAEGLERITFHEKLGTVADKVERVAKLSRWLVEEGIVKGADPDQAVLAARLCKADLVTEMVGEFPELQGLMGGYYARAEGLPDAVADAIRDHYKPVGQGDDVPTAPVTVAVSLADKLDTLVSFFAINEMPSGSKDPFALRRASLGTIALGLNNLPSLPIERIATQIIEIWLQNIFYKYHPITLTLSGWDLRKGQHDPEAVLAGNYQDDLREGVEDVVDYTINFFADRLKVQQREAGIRHDLIDAVFALGGEDDLVRLLARVHALQAFMSTEDGTNLLAGYKRASNIIKKEDWSGSTENSLSYTPEVAEKALIDALDAAGPKAASAIKSEDFAAAMTSLASLRAPIDQFFEDVTVNDDDPVKRTARLNLLARFRNAVHQVADFSKIEG